MMYKFFRLGILGACACLIACAPKQNAENQGETTVQTASTEKNTALDGFSIACIDTDTLFAKYSKVVDITQEIEKTEQKLQNDLQSQAQKFQSDYENYLKIGASLTLSEQRRKEEELAKRKEELDLLSQRYSDQMLSFRMQKMQEVQDDIFSFIAEYNKTHGNYSFVVSNSRTSGVLYSPANLDITQEVLDAINEKYSKELKTKKK